MEYTIIKEILNIEEKAYDSFYNLIDGDDSVMNKLKSIYLMDANIEDKIIRGYEYIKKSCDLLH